MGGSRPVSAGKEMSQSSGNALDSFTALAQDVVIVEAAHDRERRKHERESDQEHRSALHKLHSTP